MHPLLVKLGPLSLHTYGLMIVIGFLIALALIHRQGTKEGLDGDRIIDVSFWGLAFGLLGGRIVYVITRLSYFADHPIEVFYFWEGGLVFYGGFLGGAFAFWFFCRKYNLPGLQTIDIATPSLAIAHSFGRIGCFFAGCCYGKPAHDLPWAITFSNPMSAAPTGIPLHPTQLYDALNAFIIFSILMFIQSRKKFTGQVISSYMMLYAIGRSIVEVYRGDKIRGFVIDPYLSTSQFISILIFAAGLILYIKWSKTNQLKGR